MPAKSKCLANSPSMPRISLSTFDDDLRFCNTIGLLFPALDLAGVLGGVVLGRVADGQPAVAQDVFVNLKVGIGGLGDLFLVLGVGGRGSLAQARIVCIIIIFFDYPNIHKMAGNSNALVEALVYSMSV